MVLEILMGIKVAVAIMIAIIAVVGFFSFELWQFRKHLHVGQEITVQGDDFFFLARITYIDKDSVRVIDRKANGHIVLRSNIFK